jgi:hypothetical protein
VPLLMSMEFLRHHPNKLLSCYLGCAILISLFTIGRAGSDTYYFLDCVFILSALSAALLAKRISESSGAGESMFLLGLTVFLGQWFAPRPPNQHDFVADYSVQEYLRRNFSPGTQAFSYYAGDLVRAGLQVPFTNIYHYVQLVRNGTVPEWELVDQLDQRRFGLIVLNFDLKASGDDYWANYYLTAAMRRAILLKYRPAATLDLPGPEKFESSDRMYSWIPRLSNGE